MLAIIDADIVAFQGILGGTEDPFDGRPDIGVALHRCRETVRRWMDECSANDVLLVFSDSQRRNFRKAALDINYKGNRGSEKPEGYFDLVRALRAAFPWTEVPWLEGDDVAGILHTQPGIAENHDGSVVVSIDKDMRTIPGLLYNPDKMEHPEYVLVEEAVRFWMYQTLMGDPVDGYKGCARIGTVKADRILPAPVETATNDPAGYASECIRLTMETYRDTYGPEVYMEKFLAQARAARILHHKDYDDGKVRLWHPNADMAEWLDTRAL